MKIIIAHPVTTADGKHRKPGKAASIPDAEARDLIYRGYARAVETITTDLSGDETSDETKEPSHG